MHEQSLSLELEKKDSHEYSVYIILKQYEKNGSSRDYYLETNLTLVKDNKIQLKYSLPPGAKYDFKILLEYSPDDWHFPVILLENLCIIEGESVRQLIPEKQIYQPSTLLPHQKPTADYLYGKDVMLPYTVICRDNFLIDYKYEGINSYYVYKKLGTAHLDVILKDYCCSFTTIE